MAAPSSLIFVYNADGGIFNLVADAAHKIISPATYNCSLCALTHGHLGPKRQWTEFIRNLPMDSEFLHADEFRSRFPAESVRLPAIFTNGSGRTQLLLDADAIGGCSSLDELQNMLLETISLPNADQPDKID